MQQSRNMIRSVFEGISPFREELNDMKKLISAALCVALLLCSLTAAMADDRINASFFGKNPETDRYDVNCQSAVSIGDTLYVLADGVYRWSPGDAQPVKLLGDIMTELYANETEADIQVAFSRLFTDESALYGLSIGTGDIYALNDKGDAMEAEKLIKIDISDMNTKTDSYMSFMNTAATFAREGLLYILGENQEKGDGMKLLRFDIKTGERMADVDMQGAIGLCPYKDGKLLLHTNNEKGEYDEVNDVMRPSQLFAYDPQTDTREHICDLKDGNACCVQYAPESDTVVYIRGSVVSSLPLSGGEERVSAYLAGNVWRGSDGGVCLLSCGMIAVADYEGLTLRGLDMPGVENGALVVSGEYGSEEHRAVLAARPDISVAINDSWYNDLEAITTAMLSSDAAVDVMKLDSSYSPLDKLIDKGYALCLSDYPEIMETAGRIDPRFLEPYMRDGKLYAVPCGIYANSLGYNAETLAELGLTEDDLPKTYPEFFDFVANYMYDYGEDNPDISLFQDMSVKQSLGQRYQTDYISWQLHKDGKIAFDTEVYRDALKAMADIDYKEFDPYELMGDDVWSDEETMNDYWSRPYLFTMYADASSPYQYREGNEMQPLLLSITAEDEPIVTAMLDVLIINPRTSRMEQAVTYLAEYVKHIDPARAIALFPDVNEPIVNKSYEKDKAELQKYYDGLLKSLESADAENKASLQESIDYAKKELDGYEKYKYNVSADMLEGFRTKLAPYMLAARQTPVTDYGDDGNMFYNLSQQYNSGAIDLDKYVREMDNRIRMIQLENE